MNLEGIDELRRIVPGTYGEAITLYPWLECESHEWDNRTTLENAVYLIGEQGKRLRRFDNYIKTNANGIS
jgi:hypothetical protein